MQAEFLPGESNVALLVTCLGNKVPKSNGQLFMEETGSKEKGGPTRCPPPTESGQVIDLDHAAFCFKVFSIRDFLFKPRNILTVHYYSLNSEIVTPMSGVE